VESWVALKSRFCWHAQFWHRRQGQRGLLDPPILTVRTGSARCLTWKLPSRAAKRSAGSRVVAPCISVAVS